MDILYFAWVRERIGIPREQVETSAATVADLVAELRLREERYELAFSDLTALRVAVDQKLAEMFTLVVFYVNSSCHQQQLLHLMRRGNHRFLLCEVTHRFLNLSCSSNMAGICILHFKHANCHTKG